MLDGIRVSHHATIEDGRYVSSVNQHFLAWISNLNVACKYEKTWMRDKCVIPCSVV
jgi:hypothetical protein